MIILSPTKTMNPNGALSNQVPFFLKESNYLRAEIKHYTKEELALLMKIKGKTLETTYNYYHEPTKPYSAISMYNGIAFKQIDSYNEKYIKENVFILSALYGILNGLDMIEPYRLDFSMKLLDYSLYKFWTKGINKFIEEKNPKFILNLASKEYSKLVDQKKFNFFDVDFDIKLNSTKLKQLRGEICNYMIANNIIEIEQLKNIKTPSIKSCTINENIITFHIIVQ